jgi:hypothetical protein
LTSHHERVSGYLTVADKQWSMKYFGEQVLLTGFVINVRDESSQGPALTAFNPVAKDGSLPKAGSLIKSTELLRYGAGEFPGWLGANQINSVSMIGNYIIFAGRQGTPPGWYGEANNSVPPAERDKGFHAPPYKAILWVYDADEIMKGGKTTKPLSAFDLSRYMRTPTQRVYASAQGNTLYVLEALAENQQDEFEPYPLIHVFEVK